jgi:hypothetical protein
VTAGVDELTAIELDEVEAAVGARSFQRGRTYARSNRVLAFDWDPDEETLSGSVLGQGALYSTTAFFDGYDDGCYAFIEGECSCPVGYNCKHVAAIVIAAAPSRAAARSGRKVRAAPPRRAADERPAWEQPLRALIDSARPQVTGSPLAIELALQWRRSGSAMPGVPRLAARLMRPAARGGWVNGSLKWNALDSWQLRSGDYRSDHLALVRELYAAHRAREARAGYYYSYGAEKTFELDSFDSPQLWPLLEQARRLGIELIHAKPGLGEVRLHRRGEAVLDVTAEGGRNMRVEALVRVDDAGAQALEPLLFLGQSGHGVVCVEPTDADGSRGPETWRLHLVPLAVPAPAPLQRMVLEREPLQIPAGQLDRFAGELWPALRHVAPVVSSDGSFTPPEVSEPTLVLRVSYGADHQVELGWEFAYRIGEAERRTPLGVNGDGPGFRDLDAERAILAGSTLTETGLERFGLLDPAGRPLNGASTVVSGLDSMHLTTEMLPALERWQDIAIDITGEPADYRDVGDTLTIGVSTAEIAGERDWFDLGVTIAVEGRELPFVEVFTALASGESHMLLADGAHFSLLEPRLQELRQLIEEARALEDSPAVGQLRISRYQAGLWGELAALGVVTEQAHAWQRQVAPLLELDALHDHEPPSTLAAQLRPYQRDGFGWLASLWEYELGGILADDMGLGKTLQALALICHARTRNPGIAPFLVVAPTSVVSNWVSEAERFAPGLRVEAVTDTLAKSGRTIDEVAAADVVVTTYTLFRLEVDAYRTVPWAGLLLDEAQYVKNHQAKTYGCVRKLDAPFKLAITGTPMENNLTELWALLSITGARPVSGPQALRRAVRAADRARGRFRALGAAAEQDQAARHAALQRAGRCRAARQAGADAGGRPAPPPPQAV